MSDLAVRGVRFLAAALLCGLAACAPAERGVRVESGCFVIEGEFWRPEFDDFERLYAAHPEIRCLQLRGSPGGATLAGLRIGAMAKARSMKTTARGACVSACALAFLGGAERELGPAWRGEATYLMVHGSYDRKSGEPEPRLGALIVDWLAQRSEGKLSPTLIERIVNAAEPSGGLVASADSASFCSALGATEEARRCEPLLGATAATLGLVTEAEGRWPTTR